MTDIEPVAEGKLFQFLRQLTRLRHLGAIQQDRDDGNVALEGRPDFDSHKIVRVIQAAVAFFITRIEPVWADHREQHVTLGDLLAEHLDKVDPQRDGVDVHEQEVAAELPFQPIVHSASVAGAIVAAIADEDLTRHHQTPGGPIPNTTLSNGAHLARLLFGPHVSYFTFSPSNGGKTRGGGRELPPTFWGQGGRAPGGSASVGRCATDIAGRTYTLRALPIGSRKAASAWPLVILEASARAAHY